VSAAERSAEQATLEDGARALGTPLEPAQSAALLRLLDELERWNRSFNLTSIRDRGGMLTHHLLDSLSIRPFLTGSTVADVGTGAGFPGLPLAIVEPARRFTLIDSNNKKIRFVAHAARTLGLANVEPLHGRVEDLAPARPFDTVVARACAPLPKLLALVEPLCGPATRALAMKSVQLAGELHEVPAGWQVEAVHDLDVPGIDAVRTLAVLRPAAV
jgi:16S rRNA (guanine527-N7)-methyltransferase